MHAIESLGEFAEQSGGRDDAVRQLGSLGRRRRKSPGSPQVSKFLIPEVIFGIGALREVGGAVRRVGGMRPMLVSDPGVLAAGWVERALPHLGDVGVECSLWRDLTPNPKDFEVQAAFERYRENGCDALLAIGGGSCIDVAKAVAVLSGNGGRILDYEGIDRATRPIPPMVMVPTTGGSGPTSHSSA